MLLNLIQGREFDIRKFAEALERSAQEGVKWELRKLKWLEDEQVLDSPARKQEEAA